MVFVKFLHNRANFHKKSLMCPLSLSGLSIMIIPDIFFAITEPDLLENKEKWSFYANYVALCVLASMVHRTFNL